MRSSSAVKAVNWGRLNRHPPVYQYRKSVDRGEVQDSSENLTLMIFDSSVSDSASSLSRMALFGR